MRPDRSGSTTSYCGADLRLSGPDFGVLGGQIRAREARNHSDVSSRRALRIALTELVRGAN
jgi:hypothetical protein